MEISKKIKAVGITAIVLTCLIIIAEVFAIIYSFSATHVLITKPDQGWEGLGAAVLLILSLIIMGAILVASIIVMILSRISLKNKYLPAISKAMFILPIIFNVLNIVATILFFISNK